MDGSQRACGTRRTITLVKGAHSWVFGWGEGDEAELLRALSALAEEGRCGFEWFDAAVVSHHVGRRLGAGVQAFVGARGRAGERGKGRGESAAS